MSAQKAKELGHKFCDASWSLRLEFTTNNSKGLLLQVRGIHTEANTANSNDRFNCNDVASLPLYSFDVHTLAPHPTLQSHNYPFGVMLFNKTTDIQKYTDLVNNILPFILQYFLTLKPYALVELQNFYSLSTTTPLQTGNSCQFQPPPQPPTSQDVETLASGNFLFKFKYFY